MDAGYLSRRHVEVELGHWPTSAEAAACRASGHAELGEALSDRGLLVLLGAVALGEVLDTVLEARTGHPVPAREPRGALVERT